MAQDVTVQKPLTLNGEDYKKGDMIRISEELYSELSQDGSVSLTPVKKDAKQS